MELGCPCFVKYNFILSYTKIFAANNKYLPGLNETDLTYEIAIHIVKFKDASFYFVEIMVFQKRT